MDFGRIENFQNIDYSIPSSPEANDVILQKKPKTKDPVLYTGLPVWGDQHFIGTLYPENTKPNEFLKIYSSLFSAIELNSTFYGTPPIERIEKWKGQISDPNFKFCPKFPKRVTHRHGLLKSLFEAEEFIDRVKTLGPNLGLSFLQLPPDYNARNFDDLSQFLQKLKGKADLALELRNESWFQEEAFRQLKRLLYTLDVTLVITDTPGKRDLMHFDLTTNKFFVRFVGNSLHETDYSRIDEWMGRLSELKNKGIEESYFFVHQPHEYMGFDLIKRIDENLKEQNFHLKSPALPSNLFKETQIELI
ncbi:MAG: DUF72 domain-containing protein [Bacteriovoracaceae bacterium]